MNELEERLRRHADALDAAADHAEAARHAQTSITSNGASHDDGRIRPLRRIRPWQTATIGVAAASVVVVGLWAITAREADAPSASQPDVPTETPVATSDPDPVVETSVPVAPSAWYSLTAEGLVLDLAQPCDGCDPGDWDTLAATWQVDGDPVNGMLSLTEYPADLAATIDFAPTAHVVTRPDGAVWVIDTYKITPERRDELVAVIQPGSGLPFVLPDPAMSPLWSGVRTAVDVQTESYVLGESTDDHLNGRLGTAATVSLSSDQWPIATLIDATDITRTTVLALDAWRATMEDGSVRFVWPATDGRWADLTVNALLADRADEFAESVLGTAGPSVG